MTNNSCERSIGGATSYILWHIALSIDGQLAEQHPTFCTDGQLAEQHPTIFGELTLKLSVFIRFYPFHLCYYILAKQVLQNEARAFFAYLIAGFPATGGLDTGGATAFAFAATDGAERQPQ
jgi:hypothetical protein